jgi:hypothetical protein
MRTALASLIAAAGLVSAAQAQTPAAPAPAAQPAPAPAAAAPAAPAPAAAEAPPAPALPTSGDGAQVLQALEKVCIPAVRGQGVAAAAKAAGLKYNKRDDTYVMQLASGRDYVIIFQSLSQKDVCQAEVRFATGQDKSIVSALNIWSYLHKPELVLQANYVNVDADGVKRTRKSWEHVEANGASTAVNFSVWRKPDDTPLNGKFDTGMLFYQERAGS